jgi:hypothetical protein
MCLHITSNRHCQNLIHFLCRTRRIAHNSESYIASQISMFSNLIGRVRRLRYLPLTIISNGVAGNLNGWFGIPTQTSVPRGRSICILCSYARSPLAVQMTAWTPKLVIFLTACTMSTSRKSRNSVAPSEKQSCFFFSPLCDWNCLVSVHLSEYCWIELLQTCQSQSLWDLSCRRFESPYSIVPLATEVAGSWMRLGVIHVS